jgi:hypothetical protein
MIVLEVNESINTVERHLFYFPKDIENGQLRPLGALNEN